MRMLVYSDLHHDLHRFALKPDAALMDGIDAVVLAGDIAEGLKGLRWARETFPATAIVYVAGNHEFYGQHWDKHLDAMRTRAAEYGIHYLENDSVTIGGVRFLGCTLWTDYALEGTEFTLDAMNEARRGMNDFRHIKITPSLEMASRHKHRVFPAMMAGRHAASREWLEEQLSQGEARRTVVVTHHAPHPKSIPADFAYHPLSPCYASDLTALMGKSALWIHGHIHESMDYEIDGTRVVSNPRGYKLSFRDEMENSAFRDRFVFEI